MPGKPKGLPKSGGRVKGSVNKTTADFRKLFVEILAGEVENIKESLDIVRNKSHKDYLEIYSKYAKYFTPVQSEVKNTGTAITEIKITRE